MQLQPPEVVFADGHIQLMRWDDLFVTRYVAHSTEPQIRRMIEEHTRYVASRPDGTTLALTHVDLPEVRPPDDRVRALVRDYDAAVANKLRASATIISAGGFGGAVVRGIMSSLSLVTRRRAPQEVFSNVRSAFVFLAQHRSPSSGRTAPVDDLLAVYARACGAPLPSSRPTP